MWQESGDVEHHLCILEPSVHTVLPCGVGCRGEEGGGRRGEASLEQYNRGKEEGGKGKDGGVD